jgi:uncharacterized protein (DUF952 family)
MIYHIAYKREWDLALTMGYYETSSLIDEGFIHASEGSQVAATLERYYADKTGLVKLVIDPSLLRSQLIHEWSPSNKETFPHIYGPINIEAVTAVIEI